MRVSSRKGIPTRQTPSRTLPEATPFAAKTMRRPTLVAQPPTPGEAGVSELAGRIEGAAAVSVSGRPSRSDEAAVRVLYQWLIMASVTGRKLAFAAPFTEDADYITCDGEVLTGRRAIAASHHHLLRDARSSGDRLVGKVRRVRFLDSDVAVLYGVGYVVPRQDPRSWPNATFHELIARRSKAGWRIVTMHETRLRSPGDGSVGRGASWSSRLKSRVLAAWHRSRIGGPDTAISAT